MYIFLSYLHIRIVSAASFIVWVFYILFFNFKFIIILAFSYKLLSNLRISSSSIPFSFTANHPTSWSECSHQYRFDLKLEFLVKTIFLYVCQVSLHFASNCNCFLVWSYIKDSGLEVSRALLHKGDSNVVSYCLSTKSWVWVLK